MIPLRSFRPVFALELNQVPPPHTSANIPLRSQSRGHLSIRRHLGRQLHVAGAREDPLGNRQCVMNLDFAVVGSVDCVGDSAGT